MRHMLYLGVCGLLVGCFEPPAPPGAPGEKTQKPAAPKVSPVPNQPTEYKKEVLKPGTGTEATAGSTVEVHYTGTLADGTKFDSSLDRGPPFSFTLGAGKVIKGWDRGILGMKEGEKCRLTIPAELAYGNKQYGEIPPNSTLIFEVELLKVTKP